MPPAPAPTASTSPFERAFRAVVFDLDGTLIHSEPALIRAWTTWAIEHEVTAEQLAGFHGVPTADVVRAVLGAERAPTALARINELELVEVAGIEPLPGSAEALAVLPAERVAIATSCGRDLAAARLTASGLPRPALVVTVDDVERGKPAPDIFLAAADRLGVPPEECLVVEDAPPGLAAARAAGMATLAVTTTTAPEQLTADAVVANLAAVEFVPGPDGIRVRRVS